MCETFGEMHMSEIVIISTIDLEIVNFWGDFVYLG